MEPHWLMVVSWIALALALASALAIVADELLLGNRQHMAYPRNGSALSTTTCTADIQVSARSRARHPCLLDR